MDCLPVTGVNPVPIAVIAVVLITAAAAMLVAVRRAQHRRRTGAALTVLAALVLTGTGVLAVTHSATPAYAATAEDCLAEHEAQPADSTDGADPADPILVEDEDTDTPSTDPGTVPGATDPGTTDPTDPPVEQAPVPDYALSNLTSMASWPPWPVAYFDERYSFELTNAGEDDGSLPVSLLIPAQENGYWTAIALLNADGSVADDITLTTVEGGTLFEIATPLASGASRTLILELRYDPSTWDSTLSEPDDMGNQYAEARPLNWVTVQVAEQTADTDPSNNEVTLRVPGFTASIMGA